MTTVNLGISSLLRSNRPSGAVDAPKPQITTTRSFSGQVSSSPNIVGTQLLSINPTELSYEFFRTSTTSTLTTIVLTNSGDVDINITSTFFTLYGVQPVLSLNPNSPEQTEPLVVPPDNIKGLAYTGTIVVPRSSSTSIGLSYFGLSEGTWTNSVMFVANTDLQYYKISTNQQVGNIYELSIIPAESIYAITDLEDAYSQTFEVVPFQGETENLEVTIISEQPAAFTVTNQTLTSFTIEFDPNKVQNINGIYNATVNVTGTSGSATSTTSSNISIELAVNLAGYSSISYWQSAGSYNNSIVGVSYDRVNGSRTLTIGVGTGERLSTGEIAIPEYTAGGAVFARPESLGRFGATVNPQYPGWANVYRFPINDIGDLTPRKYYSKDYQVKNNGTDYAAYFGDYASEGSMFIVHTDSFGTIRIEQTGIREMSGDEELDRTLKNLSRALYYYSAVDDPSRFPDNATGNLDPSPINAFGDLVPDGEYTHLFLGFLTVNGKIVKSIVDLPKSY